MSIYPRREYNALELQDCPFWIEKEGLLGSAFLDESEIELSLNEFGKAGWELVSFMEVLDGLIGVFKQPLGQGLPLVEKELTEEAETSEPLNEASVLRKSASVLPDDEGPVREKVVKTGMSQEREETERTDVGNIRIE